ncbi:MAG: hypothetical protein HEQ35_02205 [Gloeotrichia echinulata IR180]
MLDFTNSRNNNRAAWSATFILTSLTGHPAAFSRSIAGNWGLGTGDWVTSLIVSRFYHQLMS